MPSLWVIKTYPKYRMVFTERITSPKKGPNLFKLFMYMQMIWPTLLCYDICTFRCYYRTIKRIGSQRYEPAVDPLDSTINYATTHGSLREEHYETAQQVKANFTKRYKELPRYYMLILGLDELSEEDRLTVGKSAKNWAFLITTFFRSEVCLRVLRKICWFSMKQLEAFN